MILWLMSLLGVSFSPFLFFFFLCIIMAMHIIYSRIMLYRRCCLGLSGGSSAHMHICALFFPILSSMSLYPDVPWTLSMYTYCMHFSQYHKAPQNKTASDHQKAKFTNPSLSRFSIGSILRPNVCGTAAMLLTTLITVRAELKS